MWIIVLGLILMVVGILDDPKAERGVGIIFMIGAVAVLIGVVVS